MNGNVTLIHRRLWPALVRLADRFPAERLASIHEEHTASGDHRKREQPFPEWVPEDVQLAAKHISEDEAVSQLPTSVAAILTGSHPNSSHPDRRSPPDHRSTTVRARAFRFLARPARCEDVDDDG